MAQLGLVQIFVIRWCHFHCLQSWPPGCVTCIATLPWIALLALSVSMELVSSSAKVTSVEFWKGIVCTDTRTHRSDPRYMMKSYHGRYMLANKSLMGLRLKMQTNLQTQRSLSIFFDIVHHVTMFGWPKVGTNIFDFLVRYIFSSIQGLSELIHFLVLREGTNKWMLAW